MKYTVDFSHITDEAAKQQAAIDEIIAYSGKEYFDNVTKAAREDHVTLETFSNMLAMFSGIEGYPVIAWYNYIYSKEVN